MTIAHVQHDLYDGDAGGTQTWDVTHPGGSDVLLALTAFYNTSWGDTVTLVKYDGGDTTWLNDDEFLNASYRGRVYYITGPATGTKAVTWTVGWGFDIKSAIVFAADWFTGVDQTTPFVGPDTTDLLSGAWSVCSHTALSAAADEKLFMASVKETSAAWPAGGTNVTLLTSRFKDTGDTKVHTQTAYASDGWDTIDYAASINTNWASIAAVLNPASAAAADEVAARFLATGRGPTMYGPGVNR